MRETVSQSVRERETPSETGREGERHSERDGRDRVGNALCVRVCVCERLSHM